MKYCQNCGKQLEDSATFCMECGQRVEAVKAPISEAPVSEEPAYTAPAYEAPATVEAAPAYTAPVQDVAPKAEKKESVLLPIMNFLASVFSVISGFFAFLATAIAYIDVDVNLYNYNIYAYGDLEVDETSSVFAFIAALIAFSFAVIGFIMSLVKRSGTEKVLSSITKLLLTSALLIAGIVLLCIM